MLLMCLYTYTTYNESRFFSIPRDHEIHETPRIQAFRETSIQRFHIVLKEKERTGVGKSATVCMFLRNTEHTQRLSIRTYLDRKLFPPNV